MQYDIRPLIKSGLGRNCKKKSWRDDEGNLIFWQGVFKQD